jgi:hypothetical protein
MAIPDSSVAFRCLLKIASGNERRKNSFQEPGSRGLPLWLKDAGGFSKTFVFEKGQ